MKKSLLKHRPTTNNCSDDTEFVYSQIRIALFNYYFLIRTDLKKRWKPLSRISRRESITALRFLEDSFKNPAKYFSRAQTCDAWRIRALNYAQENKLKNAVDAFYIIEAPKDIFINYVKDAVMSHDLYTCLYKLATNIQNWEYDRTSKLPEYSYNAKIYANEIIKTAQKTQKIVNIQDSKFLIPSIKEFLIQKQH